MLPTKIVGVDPGAISCSSSSSSSSSLSAKVRPPALAAGDAVAACFRSLDPLVPVVLALPLGRRKPNAGNRHNLHARHHRPVQRLDRARDCVRACVSGWGGGCVCCSCVAKRGGFHKWFRRVCF